MNSLNPLSCLTPIHFHFISIPSLFSQLLLLSPFPPSLSFHSSLFSLFSSEEGVVDPSLGTWGGAVSAQETGCGTATGEGLLGQSQGTSDGYFYRMTLFVITRILVHVYLLRLAKTTIRITCLDVSVQLSYTCIDQCVCIFELPESYSQNFSSPAPLQACKNALLWQGKLKS